MGSLSAHVSSYVKELTVTCYILVVLEEHVDFSPDVVYSQEDGKDHRPHGIAGKQPENSSFEPRRLSIQSKKVGLTILV